MKRDSITQNAKTGYGVAAIGIVIAACLFISGWKAVGTFFATAGILAAIGTASAHGHLSKRNSDEDKNL